MDKKMTSGEIANRVGVSQKALRIYDEKGLLKPIGFSEGNYRLYDEQSLMVLEKIIALKHVGFSLGEIKEHLENKENESISDILQDQIQVMETKIEDLNKAVKCMKSVLARTDDNPDWDDVADIIKKMEEDQGADKYHMYAVNHTADGEDWYVKIYRSLGLVENDRILDLGCGYAKLWRNNWQQIPSNVQIDGWDLHESWAEDFHKYLKDNRNTLAKETSIDLYWGNIEEEEIWKEIEAQKQYTKVVAHYLASLVNDIEALVERAAGCLTIGGMLSINYFGADIEHEYWEGIFEKLGMDTKFAIERREEKSNQHNAMKGILEKCFSKVEEVRLTGPLTYENEEELFERLLAKYPNGAKYLSSCRTKLTRYFEVELAQKGTIVVPIDSGFWHAYK